MSEMKKTKKLIFKEDAPSKELAVSLGMSYKRAFRDEDQPFEVEAKNAEMILRNYPDYFAEAGETENPVHHDPKPETATTLQKKYSVEALRAKAVEHNISDAATLHKKQLAEAIIAAGISMEDGKEQSPSDVEKSDEEKVASGEIAPTTDGNVLNVSEENTVEGEIN